MKSEELSYRSHHRDPAAATGATGQYKYVSPLLNTGLWFPLILNQSDFISTSTFIKDDSARGNNTAKAFSLAARRIQIQHL